MRINNAFLLGLVTGIGIGYYLATDNKEELIEDVKNKATRAKGLVEDGIEKGKKLISEMRTRSGEE